MTLVLATDDTGEPEIFASVQGERPSMGMPVAFMRLSRCNLARHKALASVFRGRVQSVQRRSECSECS